MLKLIIEDDEGRKTVVPFVRDEITIGRQEGNTIRLTERNVSRRHARLRRQHGAILVEDLGSYNGVRLNGERVSGQAPVQDGDLIQIGDYDLALQDEADRSKDPPQASHAESGGQNAPPGATQIFASGSVEHTAPSKAATASAMPERKAPEPRRRVSPSNGVAAQGKHRATALTAVREIDKPGTRPARDRGPDEAQGLVALQTEVSGRELASSPVASAAEPKPSAKKLPWMAVVAGAGLALLSGAVAFLVPSSSRPSPQPPPLQAASGSSQSLPVSPTGASSARPGGEREDGSRAIRDPGQQKMAAAAPSAVAGPAQSPPPSHRVHPATGDANAAKPSFPDSGQIVKKLYDQGVALLTRRRNREARDLFSRCLEVDSNFAPCHLMLGSAAARLGQAEIGAHHYEMFLKLSPTAPEAPKVRAFLEDYKHTKKRDSN